MKAATQKPTELLFPTAGLNVATEFGRQPKMTTPEGENVRAYECLENRERGGSRTGLSQFIASTVPIGAHLIQHMNVIVDPQGPALLAASPLPPGPTQADPDPRGGGRLYRLGGDGIQLNKDQTRAPAASNFVQLKQSFTSGGGSPIGGPVTTTLAGLPALSNLQIVFVLTLNTGADGFSGATHVASVTNSVGEVFTRIGTNLDSSAPDAGGTDTNYTSLSAWYRVVSSGPNDQAVIVDPAGCEKLNVVVMEYTGANVLSPLDNFSSKDEVADVSAWETGAVALANVPKEFVVTAFSSVAYAAPLYTLNGGLVARVGGGTADFGQSLQVFDRSGLQATTYTGSVTVDVAHLYVAFGLAWKP